MESGSKMYKIRRFSACALLVIMMIVMAGSAFAAKIKITSPMNIRKGPGMQYRSVAVVSSGKVLKVSKAHSTDGTLWFRITGGKYKGRYVSSQHSTTVKSQVNVKVRAQATVNFRTRPTSSAKLIRQFGHGKVLRCTGYRNGWFRIRYDGRTGYIYGYNLVPA